MTVFFYFSLDNNLNKIVSNIATVVPIVSIVSKSSIVGLEIELLIPSEGITVHHENMNNSILGTDIIEVGIMPIPSVNFIINPSNIRKSYLVLRSSLEVSLNIHFKK